MRTRQRIPVGDERGSIAVEVVLVAPLLVALLVLVAGFGRFAHTRGQVDGAAADAARSASLHRDPSESQRSGTDAARAYIGSRACRPLNVQIDTSALRPEGSVTATVRCTVSLAGLGLAGFPGSRTFQATATVPVDAHRSR